MSSKDDIALPLMRRLKRIFSTLIALSTPAVLIVSIAVVIGNVQIAAQTKRHFLPYITASLQVDKTNRHAVLEKFFKRYNSPLAENIDTFIEVADRYHIDYRLLPAISCIESSCGKKLIPGSYNPFGWGIYGKNAIYFKNFDHAIRTVAEGLSKNYFSKGYDTPEEIAPIYTPPAHGHWLRSVNFFIGQMSDIHDSIASSYIPS